MVDLSIRLYVKSVKTVTGTVEIEREYIPRPRLPTTARTEPKHEYILPEDQQRTAEMVKSIASKFGLRVEVVDVAMENIFRREMRKGREKIRIFPTLIVTMKRSVKIASVALAVIFVLTIGIVLYNSGALVSTE